MAPRVAGIDPGTVSFDLCALDGGEPFLDLSVPTPKLSEDPAPLVEALRANGPFDLVLGPAGYGLPLRSAAELDDGEIALMLLLREGEAGADVGIGGMRRIVRTLIEAGVPLVFGPGAIHLPSVPEHRKWNRVDIGTADKVASAALCIADQAERLGIGFAETSLLMLELGGAFSAALAIDGGVIVDGAGGSSGPIGARACGALDAELAYLIGPELSKQTVFSGGALDPGGVEELGTDAAIEALRADPSRAKGWEALEEGAAKALLALTAAVPEPREVLVVGRLGRVGAVLEGVSRRIRGLAPLRVPTGLGSTTKASAQGAALLADGLAGGRFAELVETMRIREARGSALDYVRVLGGEGIRLAG